MKAERKSDDVLMLRSEDRGLPLLCLAAAGILAVAAVVQLVRAPSATDTESFLGKVAGVAIMLVAFVALFERSTFAFDRRQRKVFWHRRRVLRSHGGVIPFDAIEAVVAQRAIGDSGTPSRRIVLVLRGQEVPLSVAFRPDLGGELLGTAEDLRRFIGSPARAPGVDETGKG